MGFVSFTITEELVRTALALPDNVQIHYLAPSLDRMDTFRIVLKSDDFPPGQLEANPTTVLHREPGETERVEWEWNLPKPVPFPKELMEDLNLMDDPE